MEHIYVATSPQFEGIVKIGRTDRDVDTRMSELNGYGLEAFEGETSWSTDENHILLVDDNNLAESLLHHHFSSQRVSENRELFFATDPQLIVDEALEITGGQVLADVADHDLYGTVIEEIVEWGVTIAGALTVGVVGMVLANKLHSRFKNTHQYQAAVLRGKNLVAKNQPALQTFYEQPRTILESVADKAKDSFNQALSSIKKISARKPGLSQSEIEPVRHINNSVNQSKKGKYLLGSFSTAQKAKEFVNRNPKLVIQRISHKNIELWGVYIWRHSN